MTKQTVDWKTAPKSTRAKVRSKVEAETECDPLRMIDALRRLVGAKEAHLTIEGAAGRRASLYSVRFEFSDGRWSRLHLAGSPLAVARRAWQIWTNDGAA